MSTVGHQESTGAANPAVFLRSAERVPDDAGIWGPGLFRATLGTVELEHLAGLSHFARAWRPYFEANPGWSPGEKLKALILSSDALSLRDKRQLEKLWTLRARVKPVELARVVRPLLDRIEPRDAGEAAWRELLTVVAGDIRRVFGQRGYQLVVHPEAAPYVPQVLDAILSYLRSLVVLEDLRRERIELLARRHRQLQSIAGLVEGPGDLADRHTQYASPRAR